MRTSNLCIIFLFAFTTSFSTETSDAAMTLDPGIYAPEDLTAEPELITVTSVGTDDLDTDTYRQPMEDTYNPEMYELRPGLYRFVNNPDSKTDPAALKAEAGGLIGYQLPPNAPEGPLPVTSGAPVAVSDWSLY